MGRNSNSVPPVEREYVQLNQPAGVPPLPLTGTATRSAGCSTTMRASASW